MFVYVPKHLSNIEIVAEMIELLQGYISEYGSPGSSTSFDYYYYYYTVDPVKNFIRMCLTQSVSEPMDSGILWYLIRLFYSVKGTPKVLELMESALGLELIPGPSGRKFEYTDKGISFEIRSIDTFNLDSFMDAMNGFLGALLYYNDLKAVIDEARLVIYDSLKSNVSLKSWNYMHHEISNTE